MATPITHVVLTEKIYRERFKEKNKRDFFIGTLFPDIRYLGKISRSETHYPFSNFEEIIQSDSFEAGMRFHSMLDIKRDQYLEKMGIYDRLPDRRYIYTAVKLVEDDLNYERLDNWQEYISFLDTILPQETEFVSEDIVKKWHTLLQEYFSTKNNIDGIRKYSSEIGMTDEDLEEVMETIKIVNNSKETQRILESIYDNLDSVLGIQQY